MVFISGSVTLVLALLGLLNEDILLHSEAFQGRSLIWYLGLFGGILASSRSLIPDEHQVYRPKLLLTWIIEYTHYRPKEWRGKLHSRRVHWQFQQLYQLEWKLYVYEIASVLVVPLVFLWRLRECSVKIVRFYRECSVHVQNLGHVCSYALFEMRQNGTATSPLSQGKMEMSLISFKSNYPDWNPSDPRASQLLEQIEVLQKQQQILNSSSVGPDMGFVSILHRIYDEDN